jgi:hypothetical protein
LRWNNFDNAGRRLPQIKQAGASGSQANKQYEDQVAVTV